MSDPLYSRKDEDQIPTLPNLARNSGKETGMDSEYFALPQIEDFSELSISPLISSTLNLQSAGITLSEESAPQMPQCPDQLIEQWGKYQFLDEIGRGGMGKIMLWKDQNIQRTVASKLMLQRGSVQTLQRFYEEGQITGQLEHPNIVPIYEMGLNKDGNVYFTMKYVKGNSLKQLLEKLKGNEQLRQQEWTLTKMLQIFQTVCNAIDYAHSKNVIHRDLKPDNIMLGNFGEVMVMDWGLAKVLGQGQEVLTDDSVTTLRSQGGFKTITGQVTGTPRYMAPEQAMGDVDKIDQRSDIYSLGAILYQIITGTTAADGTSVLVILMKVSQGKLRQVPKQGIYGPIPKELHAIIAKALQLSPENRYQSARALAEDIQRFLDGREVRAYSYSLWDKTWKVAKRYRKEAAVIFLTAIVLLPFFLLWSDYLSKIASEQKEKEVLDKLQTLAQQSEFKGLLQLDDWTMLKTEKPKQKTGFSKGQHKIPMKQLSEKKVNLAISGKSSPQPPPAPPMELRKIRPTKVSPAPSIPGQRRLVAKSDQEISSDPRKADTKSVINDKLVPPNKSMGDKLKSRSEPASKASPVQAFKQQLEKDALKKKTGKKNIIQKQEDRRKKIASENFVKIKGELFKMIDKCRTYNVNKEYRYQKMEANCWLNLYKVSVLADKTSWQEIAEREIKRLLKTEDFVEYQQRMTKLQQDGSH